MVNCVLEQRPILQVSPKRAISPKRELQNLVSVLGSRCSLKRPVLELSDRDSRLSEVAMETCTILSATSRPGEKFWVLSYEHSRLGKGGSPKQVHKVELMHFSSNPRPGEVCVVLSEGVTRPGERISPKRDNVMICCFKLAQARWISLSEAEGLAWARVPGLSEFMRISMFVCACVCDLATFS